MECGLNLVASTRASEGETTRISIKTQVPTGSDFLWVALPLVDGANRYCCHLISLDDASRRAFRGSAASNMVSTDADLEKVADVVYGSTFFGI